MIRSFMICLLAVVATLAQAQEMKPGLWEMASSMKMQNGMQMPENKFTHCYTDQDIKSGKQYTGVEESNCKLSNMKSSGGNISYDIACDTGGNKMNGSVKGTMSPTAFTLEQTIRMTPDPGMGEMHSTMKARRLGDCK